MRDDLKGPGTCVAYDDGLRSLNEILGLCRGATRADGGADAAAPDAASDGSAPMEPAAVCSEPPDPLPSCAALTMDAGAPTDAGPAPAEDATTIADGGVTSDGAPSDAGPGGDV